MKLNDYLEREGLSYADFAKTIGVSRNTVRRWCSLLRFPTPEMMDRIKEGSKGKVQAKDFYA